MKKAVILFISVTFLWSFMLAVASFLSPTTEIIFPNHEFGKTEYNANIYNIEPFTLQMNIPKGWRVVYPSSEEEIESGFSSVSLFQGEQFICNVSYNTFELYPDTTEENFYRSVYNQLMLSSFVTWDNNYTPIKTDENSSVAICDVLVRPPVGDSFTFPGILAYNKELLVYIIISFENCEIEISQKTLNRIAESVELLPLWKRN